ncbi:MAG: porin family protein [Clostridiaceae bacterium]|nr:porin family protein [Clostridiaceae bacterium]
MKKICRTLILAALAAFFLLTTVSIVPAAQQGGFYAGVFGSLVMPDDLDINDGNGEIGLDDSFGLGIKGGFIIPQNPWLAAELEYTYLGEQDFDNTIVSGDFSAHNFMANLLFRYPHEKIHPFIGAGIGFSKGTVEIGSWDEDDTAFAWQLVAGVNFELAPQISLDLAYKYFNSEYDIEDVDVEAQNHMIQVGVNYHF